MTLSIIIISSRESLSIISNTIDAAISACKSYNYTISLLLNGNETAAIALSKTLLKKYSSHLKIWFFPLGDKANCFNKYCYFLSDGYDTHFFIDGYVTIDTDSIETVMKAACENKALAYTGVPTTGASHKKLASEMLSIGGLHGNFFMIPKESMDSLKNLCFKLPLGIYRTDSTIGAAINFGYAPDKNSWAPANILVVPNVTWKHAPLKWYKLADVKTQIKRYLRQSLGKIENLAVKEIFADKKLPVSKLPEYSYDLCFDYLSRNKLSKLFLILNPGAFLLENKLSELAQKKPHFKENKDKFWELKLP